MSSELYFANALIEHEVTDGALRFAAGIRHAARYGLMEMERYLQNAMSAVAAQVPTMAWQPVRTVGLQINWPEGERPHDWLRSDVLSVHPIHRARRSSGKASERVGDALDVLWVHTSSSALSVDALPRGTSEVELRQGKRRLRVGIDRLSTSEADRLTPRIVELLDPDDDISQQELKSFFDDKLREVFPVEAEGPDTRRPKGKLKEPKRGNGIDVLGCDATNQRLFLEHLPPSDCVLAVPPNTYTLKQQIFALQRLRDRPLAAHRPLLRLFQHRDKAERYWPRLRSVTVDTWHVLTEEARDGTAEQRRFVEAALGSPDFALLEGPPGSGKTTVICELVRQLVESGKRVLLCASTHVAVDNVIERLKGPDAVEGDRIHLVRIGDDDNVKRDLQPFTLKRLRKTWMSSLKSELGRPGARPWQAYFKKALDEKQGRSVLDRLILDTAQVVCGTTIGILKHPDIRRNKGGDAEPPFDVMILDEASKTPFPEFLVPAMWARRWLIIGDPKQLSPYVETDWVEAHLASRFGQRLNATPATVADACVTLFEALAQPWRGAVVVEVDTQRDRDVWATQARAIADRKGWIGAIAVLGSGDVDRLTLATAQVVIGVAADLERADPWLPLDTTRIYGSTRLAVTSRRHRWDQRRPGGKRRGKRGSTRKHDKESKLRPDPRKVTAVRAWANSVAWRMVRDHELRQLRVDREQDHGAGTGQPDRYHRDLQLLMPADDFEKKGGDIERMVLGVQQIALPSVLESLQRGVGRRWDNQPETALNDGLPGTVLQPRHVLLRHQHRMDPTVSAFPRRRFYGGKALNDASTVHDDRGWSFGESGVIWRSVDGKQEDKPTRNPAEVEAMLTALRGFRDWARGERHPKGRPWQVAALTFYRGQESALRNALRKLTGQHGRFRSFEFKFKGEVTVQLELCTVDRFQGHEADWVLLSCVRTYGTGFLDSPNRLNVGLTRARHLLTLVGHRGFWKGRKHKSAILRALAEDPAPGDIDYASGQEEE